MTIIESILLHSADLFRINLRGVNILLPLYLDAIERYLQSDAQALINYQAGAKTASYERFTRIRSKCIQILMSVVSLPFHYEHLQQNYFEDYLEKSIDVQTPVRTFAQCRQKIFRLLSMALQWEQDTANAQALFGEKSEARPHRWNDAFVRPCRHDPFGLLVGGTLRSTTGAVGGEESKGYGSQDLAYAH